MTNGNDMIHSFLSSVSAEGNDKGLTKREYFASNCPDTIPKWFDNDVEVPKKDYPNWDEVKWDSEEDRETIKGWLLDGCFDLPDNLKWYGEKHDAYYDKLRVAEKQRVIDRYFAWRTFYADNLIKTLNK